MGLRPRAPKGERMESRIERICVEHGLKMTGQRRVIARVLSDAEDHPDVEELYRRASALDERISIATVYRTVRLLEERGILERRDFGGGRARYEPTEHGQHYHLIDIETGSVIEFGGGEHERLMRQIASNLGFDLVSTRLEIYGRKREPASHGGGGTIEAAADLAPDSGLKTGPLEQHHDR
jgi:Fur family ferric uptake transcriptional regulator